MNSKHKLLFLVVLALALAFGVASAAEATQPKVHFWLTILHNNDGESKLINIGSDLPDFGGVDRFKSVVDNLKWEATHGVRPEDQSGGKRGVLMVSSGDNFLAGPEFNASIQNGAPFYDTVAMDLIGYDAVAIGNHDFDFGPDILADFISGYQATQPTYLSANLDFSGEPRLQSLFDQGQIAASVVVKERGENIGIIGATTPNLVFISSPRNVIVGQDVAASVQAEIDKLESMGIEKIILVSHLQDANEDIALAAELEGIDVMVAGGGDEVLANPDDLLVPGDEAIVAGPYPLIATDMNGVEIPVVTTAGNYSYVGRLVVGFDLNGNVIAIGENSGPIRVAGGDNPDAVTPDPTVKTLVVDPVTAEVEALATNVIASSDVNLDGLRSSVRSKETNQGNLIADGLLWQGTQLAPSFGVSIPDVALQNGGGIRNDSIIPPGDFTELFTWQMVPFGNFASIVENVPREQFKEILENAVSRIPPAAEPGGTGRFAQIAGFSFTFDTTGDAMLIAADGTVLIPGTRVKEVMLEDGTPIVSGGVVIPGPNLTIVTLDFLLNGGDQYPYRGLPFTRLGVTDQQALHNYIVNGLGGVISGVQYPEGGEGRITQLP